MDVFGVAYGKKSLEEILFKMLLRKKYNHHSGRQQIKSLTKILTENALEYLASGKGFYGDRLTGSKSKLES